MSRASDGTYTLPAGNPVTTLTTITSTWANTTLDDIATAMTDSLSRSGSGPMTAPLELAAGTVSLPALTWDADTAAGLYRIGANDYGFAIAGAKVLSITTNEARVSGTSPHYALKETDAAVNNTSWDIAVVAEQLSMRVLNDAENSSTGFFLVNRTLNTVDSVEIAASDIILTGTVTLDGDIVLDGDVTVEEDLAIVGNVLISNNAPTFTITDENAASNETVWQIAPAAGIFVLKTLTDALGAGTTALAIDRAGATVTTIALTASTSITLDGPVIVANQTVGTTVGAAGAASALPANPTGYITVTINGTARKIPYYAS